ncbi:GDP-mannose mannosyl hydrolase [Agarivorans sp. Alg241-V36]|uniref:GDP-mannose mannosyl hydrolase n=1 Tax=Agarivorans sp. Alg241-V36 TaxID=2305992 RepID=UPI0013D2386D|nr:GDP-mannose mannosyl hydrolase [Agarivorans sp. Alg241-V36]
MLELETFKTVIQSTPLVSIDFIVRNTSGQILLGKRNNRPAKGYWFVPGGRVLKDEPLDLAFSRLLKQELGIDNASSSFKGVYQHFYEDNVSSNDFSTHYVVLAYDIVEDGGLTELPDEQHCDYYWFDEADLLRNKRVHRHTQWYFQANKRADNSFM